jgi:acetolactate synthase I/III small subunit
MNRTVIELTANNHPGIMSKVTGLFSRRSFNLDGILCSQMDNSAKTRIFLLVDNSKCLDQVVKQLEKLYDIHEVSLHDDYALDIFNKLDFYCNGAKE